MATSGSCSGTARRPESGSGSRSPQLQQAGGRRRRGPGALATAYLVLYNVVMTAGWLVIAVGLVRAYLATGSYHKLYHSIEKPLKFFQTGALLEIVHCAVGIVPSSVVLTAFQIMSRVFLTWGIAHSVKEAVYIPEFFEQIQLLRMLCKVKIASFFLWLPGQSQRSSVTLSTHLVY